MGPCALSVYNIVNSYNIYLTDQIIALLKVAKQNFHLATFRRTKASFTNMQYIHTSRIALLCSASVNSSQDAEIEKGPIFRV